MPTFKEIALHLKRKHGQKESVIFRESVENDGDLTIFHDELHSSGADHTHNTDGTIVSETKTVFGGRTLTMTSSGWSLDGTNQEIISEFISVLKNRRLTVSFSNELKGANPIKGQAQYSVISAEAESDGLVELIRLLLGELYSKIADNNLIVE